MKRKTNVKEEFSSSNEEKEKEFSFRKFLYLNWIPIVLTSIIICATIIVVPIIYSLKPTEKQNTSRSYLWNTTGQTILRQQILLDGTNETLGEVSSLFFDFEENLNILDRSRHRLIRWRNGSSSLDLLVGHLNGSEGNNSFSLNRPNDLFVDPTLKIFIVDTMNNRIQFYSKSNEKMGQTLIFRWSLNRPMSITSDLDKSIIYISDYGNHRILQYNLQTNESEIVIDNQFSENRNQFLRDPISIRFDSTSNSLLIAQELSFNVVRWKIGQLSWSLVAGSRNSDLSGTSRTLFNRLCSINLDQLAKIYVVDCLNERIQFFDHDLTKGKTILGVIQASGNNSLLFSRPTSITFDSQTNIYLADSLNYRIQFFSMV